MGWIHFLKVENSKTENKNNSWYMVQLVQLKDKVIESTIEKQTT